MTNEASATEPGQDPVLYDEDDWFYTLVLLFHSWLYR